MCAGAAEPAQRLPTVCTWSPSITIFHDRYIQMSFDCMDRNSASSWGNEIKGAAVVMDRLVSWFGG